MSVFEESNLVPSGQPDAGSNFNQSPSGVTHRRGQQARPIPPPSYGIGNVARQAVPIMGAVAAYHYRKEIDRGIRNAAGRIYPAAAPGQNAAAPPAAAAAAASGGGAAAPGNNLPVALLPSLSICCLPCCAASRISFL